MVGLPLRSFMVFRSILSYHTYDNNRYYEAINMHVLSYPRSELDLLVFQFPPFPAAVHGDGTSLRWRARASFLRSALCVPELPGSFAKKPTIPFKNDDDSRIVQFYDLNQN